MDIPYPFPAQLLGTERFTDFEIVLRENRPLRLTRARGRRIVCISGCTWITAPAVAEDIYLKAGEGWLIPNQGLVLVEAVGSATVILRRQAAARPS